jgi:hypothetical protein
MLGAISFCAHESCYVTLVTVYLPTVRPTVRLGRPPHRRHPRRAYVPRKELKAIVKGGIGVMCRAGN